MGLMGLFTPIYMKGNLNTRQVRVAIRKVEKMTDQAKLAAVALEGKDKSVRSAAVGRLEDANLVADLALSDPSVEGAAFERLMELGDEAALAKALIHSEGLGMKKHSVEDRSKEVLEHIRDQKLVAQVALTAKSRDARLHAVRKLDDQAALAEIARRETDWGVRSDAVMQLTDAALLAKIALEDPSRGIRFWAVNNKHLKDAAVLARAALEDKDSRVRLQAMQSPYMTDPAVMAKAALEDPDEENRFRALRSPRLSDADVFDRAANDATAGYPIRWAAATRLAAVDPDRAVKPLVELLKDPKSQEVDWYKETADLCRNAIAFLELRYKATPDRAVKSTIASIPNGKYGWEQEGSCYMHWDETAHFDIPR